MSDARGKRHLRLVSPTDPQPVGAVSGLESNRLAPRQLFPPEDHGLVRQLGSVELDSVDTAVWRHVSPREQPRPDSGEGARELGGRFNPAHSFPVVYGSLSRATAGEEFRALAQRNQMAIGKLLPRHLYRFRIRSSIVLDLRRPEVRESLGLPLASIADIPRTRTQLIGELSHALGIGAIIAPSPTGDGDMIAVFPELIPSATWDMRHIELWMTEDEVPRGAEVTASSPSLTG